MKKKELFLQIEQAGIFKCLSHPIRISILQILSHDEACVCHMEAVLGVRQSYLSQQLSVLRENGLITDRKDGRIVYYQLENPHILNVLDSVTALIPEIKLIPFNLRPENCPCPKCNSNSQDIKCSD